MKASVSIMLQNVPPKAIITHKKEEIMFVISVFGKQNLNNGFDVFEQINQYWAELSEEKQDYIFSIYKNISVGFDSIWNKNELTEYLMDQIKLLMDEHSLDNMMDWVTFRSKIIIPTSWDMKTEYKYSVDNNNSREKTYIRPDYVKLIAMSLSLRCMIPVWGEYINMTRADKGTRFKEYYAFQLLNKTPIIHSAPMEKLRVYIESNSVEFKNNPNHILSGISSEDFVYYLMALVCVRKLCVADIRGIDDKISVIVLIWNFIRQKMETTNNNFEDAVKEKTFYDGDSEETKTSTLEIYKIKTNVSPGEIVELEFCVKDTLAIAQRLSYKVSPQHLERSLETTQILLQEQIVDPTITLLCWVFKPVISSHGLPYLPRQTIVRNIAVLEAVLWARGHKYLALLASSFPVISERDMIISPVDSKMRIPKELTDEVEKLYPFTRVVSQRRQGSKEINLALKAIDILADQLMMYSWKPTADDALLMEVFGSVSRRLVIRPDIKTHLAKLIIEFGQDSWL